MLLILSSCLSDVFSWHLRANGRQMVSLNTFIHVPAVRGYASSSRQMMELLWKEFFQDPSQFYDVRAIKSGPKSPDFRHKRSGKGLWIGGFYNPSWVSVKLQNTELPQLEVNKDRLGIIHLIKSCAKKKDISTMNKLITDKSWIIGDISIANTLICSYAKCGAVKEAREVFYQLEEQSVVSWNALIAGYVDQGLYEDALRCFRDMERERVIPNSVTYVCILKACCIVRALVIVEEIHMKAEELGLLKKDIALGTTLVNAYAKCGAVRKARKVFDQIVEQDVVSWTALIAGNVKQGFGEEALTCFREMQRGGVIPNSVTYACSLKACAITRALDIVIEIHKQVREKGFLNKDVALGNSLVSAYAKCGAVKQAQEVFDQLVVRNVVSWNALISGYTEHGLNKEALACFSDMKSDGITPNSVTYICCLKACGAYGDMDIVKDIHAQVRELGLLKRDVVLGNSLVNAYAKCGAIKEAQEVFDQLAERDVVSWSALIAGYAEHGFGQEALACFRQMESDGVTPNSVTYVSCLKACAIIGALEVVEEIHTQVREQGLLNKDIVLGNSLVNVYAKCGAVKEAHELFDEAMERNVECCTALLAGYAQLGRINEMVQLFSRMKIESTFPDTVTLLVLLSGCGHGPMIKEEQRLCKIIGTYGLSPTPEHHTCMVDFFGHAGQLGKAKCFVIDHKPTLLAFLGACQKWVNVNLGRWAFDKLLQLDETCSRAYVYMANIYVAVGMRKEADEVESLRVNKSGFIKTRM